MVYSLLLVILVFGEVVGDDVSRESRQTGASVQLVGGQYPWEGRIFVRGSDGRYGGLCSSYLTSSDYRSVCRSVFNNPDVYGTSRPVSAFGGNVESNVITSSLHCTGTETDINDCQGMKILTWSSKSSCIRGQAAVSCQADTRVRLAGGRYPYQGRLELFVNGTWQSVCNKAFTSNDARVFCRKLGFWNSKVSVMSASSYGAFTGPIVMENLTCTGDEPDSAFCTWDTANCTHAMDVGLNCQPQTLPISLIKLTDGEHPWSGRLEVYNQYSVCGRNTFSSADIKAACSTLGYKYSGRVITAMPEAKSKVHLKQFVCKTTDTNIGQCQAFEMTNSNDCGSYPPTTLALDCSGGMQVRLVGGTNLLEGRVEIFSSGKWAPVVSTVVQTEEAIVLCASLGYQTTHAKVLPANTFGTGSSTEINSLVCSSNMKHVSQCTVGAPAANSRPTFAAIRCFNCSRTYTTESGTITSDGYPGSASENTDCLYHIHPNGSALLYKMSFYKLQLGYNAILQVSENPITGPIKEYTGHIPADIHLFKKDLYIRFKTSCCGPRSFYIRWQPVTLESTAHLTCTDTFMGVSVNITELRWLYPDTNPAYISLINEGCTGSYSGDTWTINNPHSDCFTSRKIDNKEITYSNALIYKEIGSGPIVREHRWRVDLECAFNRDVQISQNYKIETLNNYMENLTSVYQAEIHMYNDSTLTHEMSFEPIRAKLGDDLYVKVNLKGNWDVKMRLQNCVGKPNPNSTISYALIHNGCATDSETHVVYEDPTTTLFHFKAFEFYAGYSTVYLSCDIKFCTPSDFSSVCRWKCNTSVGKRDNSVIQRTGYSLSKQLDITT